MKKWILTARELPVGGKVQIECPENCGGGEKLSVNHSVKSYWCNCYRCGFTDTESKGAQTLAEIQRINELNEQATKLSLKMELPDDFNTDIPRHGRAWLFKAGINEEVYKEYGFGYSKRLDRVVMPVRNDTGELLWYQCRALHYGQKPKYLQPSADRNSILFKSHNLEHKSTSAVVVEDILSAIRVGKHTQCYSLLGTGITTSQAAKLSKYRRVTTWLDPDRAGRVGAYKIRKVLGLVTEVANIVTEKDPKELSDKEIIQCIHHSNQTVTQ